MTWPARQHGGGCVSATCQSARLAAKLIDVASWVPSRWQGQTQALLICCLPLLPSLPVLAPSAGWAPISCRAQAGSHSWSTAPFFMFSCMSRPAGSGRPGRAEADPPAVEGPCARLAGTRLPTSNRTPSPTPTGCLQRGSHDAATLNLQKAGWARWSMARLRGHPTAARACEAAETAKFPCGPGRSD